MFDTNTLNPKQQRIYEWIDDTLRLPVYADVFRSAAVLFNQQFPGYMPFVAHAGREIMNGLARAYRGDERIQVQYVNHLNKIAPKWDDRWGGPFGFDGQEEPSHHEIPRDICKMVKSLIDEHREGRLRSQETNEVFFLTFLDCEDRNEIPETSMQEWKDAKNWFSGRAHISENTFGPDQEPVLAQHFQTLETYLSIAANSRQYKRIRGIDDILEETNG